MNKKLILLVLIVFSLGWFSSTVYSILTNNTEKHYDPTYDIYENDDDSINIENVESSKKSNLDLIKEFEKIEKLLQTETNKDKDSPYDWISMDQISVYNDRVILKINNPEWSMFTDTNSMDPVIDSTSNAIEIIPKSHEDIHVGDIVAYRSKYKDGVITHRIVDIGSDTQGWYAKLKGDNNDYQDPGKIRFDQIERVVVAIIY